MKAPAAAVGGRLWRGLAALLFFGSLFLAGARLDGRLGNDSGIYGDGVCPFAGVDVGAGAAVGVGVGVGAGAAVGVGVGVGVGFGVGVGVAVGVGDGVGFGLAFGLADGLSDGLSDGIGTSICVGICVCVGLGAGAGVDGYERGCFGVGFGVCFGVSFGADIGVDVDGGFCIDSDVGVTSVSASMSLSGGCTTSNGVCGSFLRVPLLRLRRDPLPVGREEEAALGTTRILRSFAGLAWCFVT